LRSECGGRLDDFHVFGQMIGLHERFGIKLLSVARFCRPANFCVTLDAIHFFFVSFDGAKVRIISIKSLNYHQNVA
jgi:hypothetical protein